MEELPQSIIVGTWRVERMIPTAATNPELERFLHFSSDGLHLWEHPFANGFVPQICSFRYTMTGRGVFITPIKGQKGWELPFTVDGERVLFTSKHRSWWLRRIPPAEKPEFLTHYYSPP